MNKSRLLFITLFIMLTTLNGCCSLCPQPPQESQVKWTTLDSSKPPGTPARISIDKEQSNAFQTIIDLHIYGFWVEQKRGPDNTLYQKIDIPGLGSYGKIGAPALPVARFNIAIPTDAKIVKMEVTKKGFRTFPDYLVWPQPVPELDHPEGAPEKFMVNKKLYAAKTSWPPSVSRETPKPKRMLRSIPSVSIELWPVNWNPSTRDLHISSNNRYTYQHKGAVQKYKPITKERVRQAKAIFVNWEAVAEFFPGNFILYKSDFLIIYPSVDYQDELAPFVTQKRARGFRVTEKMTSEIGTTCADIRSAIQTWEADVPVWHDAYLLLVGDVEHIPLCTSPTGDPTDDLYASTDGDDLDEEIYVGRLSVDNEADAANQINKILTYEDSPSLFCCYHLAGLWAHKENAPGKYEGAHETVRTNSYTVTPSFLTFYGSQTGVTDSDINSRVDSGAGVLAYRGHGNWDATATGWNQTSEYYNSTDATALGNPVSRSPVVWSFACTNTALSHEDSISEIWLEQEGAGAVSYYGATVPSYTSQNHVLDEWMFLAVYDEGLVTQSHAIERAEAQMASIEGSTNAWMYLLLGDPDMVIRRENPIGIKLPDLKEYIQCRAPCFIELQVLDDRTNPIKEALVGFYKPGASPKFGDEVFVNQYANNSGHVKIKISPKTSGPMYYSVEDGLGNARFGKVDISLSPSPR